MTQRLTNAISKLQIAYENGTLDHCNGCCAGGILLGERSWPSKLFPMPVDTMLPIGYTIKEIFEVERRFEGRPESLIEHTNELITPTLHSENDKDGFLGMMAVIEYLTELEEVEVLENAEV